MTKLKHSKYKNTGILFELLVRQIATDTLNNRDSKATDIIKEFFGKTMRTCGQTDSHLNFSNHWGKGAECKKGKFACTGCQ